MKKIEISLMLVVFLFSVFYPTIYAFENIVETEIIKQENSEEQEEELEERNQEDYQNEETVDNPNVEKKEEEVSGNEMQEDQAQDVAQNAVGERAIQEDEKNIVQHNVVEIKETTQVVNEREEEASFEEKQDVSNVGIKYGGRIHIENPIQEQKCILPDLNILKIQGWAVSNDSNATLELYVNNKFVEIIKTRSQRMDVDNIVSPDFGGNATTPNAGFETSIDISNYVEGDCLIRIDEKASTGETVATDLRVIKIAKKIYKGKMYIESPSNNQEVTLPEGNSLKIQGWAVSEDTDATLKLYVNNKFVKKIDKRVARTDVDTAISPSFGGTGTTPKAGFEDSLDISTYEKGTHEIKIEEVSRFGQIIATEIRNIEVKQTKYKGKMYIESPSNNQEVTLPEGNSLKIQGWAVSEDTDATLKLYVNNKFVKKIDKRVARTDVDTAISPSFGGTGTTPKAGFEDSLDISTYGEGTYVIKIEEVSRFGQIIATEIRNIEVKQTKYKGKMYIESPSNNQEVTLPEGNSLKIQGWAVSEDTDATLKLYVNNKFVKKIDKRVARTDVDTAISPSFGGTGTTPKAGFEDSLDISTYAEGTYVIKIEEVSRFGQIIAEEARNIQIKQKQYSGKVWVESPLANTKYNLPDTTRMKIQGWAVSEDIGSYVLVYIDGRECSFTSTRTERADVDALVSPSFGGTESTPKAGFLADVDISKLNEGAHTISVMIVSRFHKIMDTKKFVINISTPTYDGLMNIETPVQNRRYQTGWLEVQGWAVNGNYGDSVAVYLDGRHITYAERRERADVMAIHGPNYGGYEANRYSGFFSRVSTEGLAEGTHTVKLVNYSSYGKKIGEAQVNFVISNTQIWGIDVSHHNGDINWEAVRNQGVAFAILKIGEFRESSGRIIQDEHFERNYNECKRLGIAVGGYFYSYAFDPTEASHEAIACLSIIQGKTFEMPIFLDIEDPIVKNAVDTGRTNVQNLTNGAVTFCQMMNNSGYQAGVYASKNFFYQYLDRYILENYNIWLAHYTDSTDYLGRYDMWQYTSDGSLPGIDGRVDFNWCFKRY